LVEKKISRELESKMRLRTNASLALDAIDSSVGLQTDPTFARKRVLPTVPLPELRKATRKIPRLRWLPAFASQTDLTLVRKRIDPLVRKWIFVGVQTNPLEFFSSPLAGLSCPMPLNDKADWLDSPDR
jgi:hypothetical protein